ncbi:MAG: zinc ribbon domain-containing protein [Paracoccaceae bacterium]
MISHHLALDYTLAPGWMTPFVEGVKTGVATGRKCTDCAKVSFPPVRICPCGSTKGTWVALSGQAEITWRTDGADGSFALVRFEGANTLSSVKLIDVDLDTTNGRLAASEGELPMLLLTGEPNAQPN